MFIVASSKAISKVVTSPFSEQKQTMEMKTLRKIKICIDNIEYLDIVFTFTSTCINY